MVYHACSGDGSASRCNPANGGSTRNTTDPTCGGQCPSPPPPSNAYACLNGKCVESPGSGVPKDICDRVCVNPDAKYVCNNDKCVLSLNPTRGVDKATCEATCE